MNLEKQIKYLLNINNNSSFASKGYKTKPLDYIKFNLVEFDSHQIIL